MLPRDAHTHRHATDALVNVDPTERETLPEGVVCSAGIHPWRVAEATPDAIERLERWGADPAVAAIGETGLDKNYPHPELQLEMLRRHIALSERCGKPLILHIVRAYDTIVRLRATLSPRQPWVIHGFRGKPQLAQELVRGGFYVSFGARFNPESLRAVPPSRRLAETDDHPTLTIADIEALHRAALEGEG